MDRLKGRRETMKLTFEHAKTVLCVLVIPLALWGVKLEVNNAVMIENITRMEGEIEKANETRSIVQQNRVTLALLKERIDNANETLRDIKNILRDRDSRGGN
jgi:hypothetical protein